MTEKLVFVTGASRGIGRAIAEAFIDEGYRVAVGYQNNREMAEEVCQGNANALAVQLEVGDRASI
jgi:NAD(P)-dependent dehydrogenase (short-subunit alcohol dehydrogenase family)